VESVGSPRSKPSWSPFRDHGQAPGVAPAELSAAGAPGAWWGCQDPAGLDVHRSPLCLQRVPGRRHIDGQRGDQTQRRVGAPAAPQRPTSIPPSATEASDGCWSVIPPLSRTWSAGLCPRGTRSWSSSTRPSTAARGARLRRLRSTATGSRWFSPPSTLTTAPPPALGSPPNGRVLDGSQSDRLANRGSSLTPSFAPGCRPSRHSSRPRPAGSERSGRPRALEHISAVLLPCGYRGGLTAGIQPLLRPSA
jgi:hypothetical protein